MAAVAVVIATHPLALAAQAQTPHFMYVGSFTTPERGHGEGITVFRRGPSGGWSQVQLLKDLENPSFLIIDRQGRFLYAVHSDGDRASAYRIESSSGRLAP